MDLVDKPHNETLLIQDATPTTSGNDWRMPFVKYLSDGSGFQDRTENERLIRRSENYIMVNGRLMQKKHKLRSPIELHNPRRWHQAAR